jgi:hypothetical protein
MTTLGWRRLLGLLAVLVVAAGLAAGCSDDDDSADGPDDSAPSSEVAEGDATGPTVAPGQTVPTSTPPEIPDPPPIPAEGEATLELDGEPIEVVLNRCEYNPNPEVGLDVTMNPPTASEDNPAGLVLLVPGAVAGPNLVDAISAALQLEGDPTFLPLDGRLDLADDLLSGTLIFQVVRGETAQIGTAAFNCSPEQAAGTSTTTTAP